MKEIIGFIGLGTMGKPMAERLLQAGYSVVVYDRVSEKIQPLVTGGAQPASSSRELAFQADIIISMLPQPADIEAVVLGKEGIIQEMGEGKIFIDMSTSSLDLTQRIHLEVEAKNGKMLDAPVSGGMHRAQKGTLSLMVGGGKETFLKCNEIFQVLGENIHYVGKAGNGLLLKLLNNLLYAANMCAAAEILALGEKMGIELDRMVGILKGASASSYCLHEKALTYILPGEFAPGFSTDLLLKDMGLALDIGKKAGYIPAFGQLSHKYFLAAREKGLGGEDNSAIIKLFQVLVESSSSFPNTNNG